MSNKFVTTPNLPKKFNRKLSKYTNLSLTNQTDDKPNFGSQGKRKIKVSLVKIRLKDIEGLEKE